MTVEKIRQLVRPFVTILFSVALVVFTGMGMIDPKEFVSIVFMIIGFWFGSRPPQQPPTPTP